VLPGKSASGWTYGVVIGHEITDRLEAEVELHGEGARSFHATELAALAGVRWKLHAHLFLLASLGRELRNHFESGTHLLSYFAVQWLR
jgi:hypothetical protein